MSIKKYAVEETSTVHLKDANDALMYADGPDGLPDKSKPMRVTLYGPGSSVNAKVQAGNNNKLFTRLKKKGKEDQNAEEQALEAAENLVALTKSFENIDYDVNGQPLNGKDLYRAVYLDTSIGFVADQLRTHLRDWGNFTKSSEAA